MGQEFLPTKPLEFIKNSLYFLPYKPNIVDYDLFSIDDKLIYENFNNDFGPLNLACLYKYCKLVDSKIAILSKALLHYSNNGPEKLSNAAYLIGSYLVINNLKNPKEILNIFESERIKFLPFRDASLMPTQYALTLENVWEGVEKACHLKFLDFSKFDLMAYEHYEKVENGDMNWIIPGKILAFCGPECVDPLYRTTFSSNYLNGKNNKETPNPGLINLNCNHHPPEFYVPYFKASNVCLVVRLNEPDKYQAQQFIKNGIHHRDLFFPDGALPTMQIVKHFLHLCKLVDNNLIREESYDYSGDVLAVLDSKNGCANNNTIKRAMAVHCKAGLGRTGTLIACYLIAQYKFKAHEAIGWIRICRPGSILGHQQNFLEKMESYLLEFYEKKYPSYLKERVNYYHKTAKNHKEDMDGIFHNLQQEGSSHVLSFVSPLKRNKKKTAIN